MIGQYDILPLERHQAFVEWLYKQRKRDSPLGDLASDAASTYRRIAPNCELRSVVPMPELQQIINDVSQRGCRDAQLILKRAMRYFLKTRSEAK